MDDVGLSRREFLTRTAYAAGVAATASLPVGTLLEEASKAQAAGSAMPSPRNMEIDHFVLLMMENRSFDHYFGWLSEEADAVQNTSYPALDGTQVPTRPASTMGDAQWQGCGHPDPGHGWDSGRAQLRGGFLAEGSGNDEFALTFYNHGDLGFIHEAARAYTMYDRYFCSLLASTWPNRYYKWSAQSGGRKTNDPPISTLGNQWETIFDRALKTPGLTARYYNSDLPFSAVWGPRAIPWTNPIARYYADCAAGTLPNIAIVDPPFRDGGGFDGNSADEHPLGDVRLGQAFMSDAVHAFMESPNYRRGALFIIYDEWGGFFDHVTPPVVPDDRASSDLDENFGQMGFRTPAVAVSPHARGNPRRRGFRVDHGQYGHESIIKLITYRFGLGSLTLRDSAANNVGLSFDWGHPVFEPPELPDPAHIASRPCSIGGGDVLDTQQAHESDLRELEALADRFGFTVGDGAPEELFREPDSVSKALAGSG